MFTICTCMEWLLRRTLYLMFMNEDFTTKSMEQIKQELKFCGLDEEKLKEISQNLNFSSSQQYVLENHFFSGANTTINVILGIIAIFLLITVFNSTNPSALLTSSKVSNCLRWSHSVHPRNEHHHSLFRCDRSRWEFGGSAALGEVPAGPLAVPPHGLQESHRCSLDRSSGHRKDRHDYQYSSSALPPVSRYR